MLFFENMAALAAFALCLVAFALGYALRNWADDTRAEWARYSTYRQGKARKRAGYRRANNGGL